jgi:hypothetical protein
MSPLARDKGAAMMLVLVLLAASVILGAACLTTASIHEAASLAHADMSRAQCAAESGVQHAMCLLMEDPSALAGSDVTPAGPFSVETGGDTYKVSVKAVAGLNTYSITSTGFHGRSKQTVTALVSAGNRYSRLVLAQKPVGYWRLGDKGGIFAANAVSTGSGQYSGTPWLDRAGALSGDSNGAVWFDGFFDHVKIPHHNSLLLDSGTVQFWYRNPDVEWSEWLFSKDAWGMGTGGHVAIWVEGRKVKARLGSTFTDHYVGSEDLASDTWRLVTLTFGDQGMKLYVDDTLVSTNAYKGGLGASSGGLGNFEPIILAANQDDAMSHTGGPLKDFFSGLMDEVAIYDHALTDGQIKEMYDARLALEQIESWQE